jgi:multicomponent Na+:H+ antiporter subunit B
MRLDVILRVATKLLLPLMLVFALYVQFHGDYGPGGGFQAGVIAAGAVILYGLVYGLEKAERLIPVWWIEAAIPAGVLLYGGTGLFALFGGGNFLDYGAFEPVHLPVQHERIQGQEWGVFIVEAGVFLTVAATMLAIFYAFADRDKK